MKLNNLFSFLFLFFLPFISSAQAVTFGDVLQAKTTVNGTVSSEFSGVTTDSNGNSYGAGAINSNGVIDFGNGVTVNGSYSSGYDILLVKFNGNGKAQWAKSVASGSNKSVLNAVTTDSNGNVYVAGYVNYDGTYDLGNGVTVTGAASSPYSNILVAKYDANGNALWAKSTSSASSRSELYDIAVDSSGNSYVAGFIYGNGAFGFEDGITATGSSSNKNIILIKYDVNGTAQWAKTVSGSTIKPSDLYGVALDNAGNPFVAGTVIGAATFDFGNSVSVTKTVAKYSIILVKYDSNGNAQWAKTTTSAPGSSYFRALAIDNSGNIFGAGNADVAGTYGFGDGVNATAPYSGNNALFLKYNSTGNVQWARFPTAASGATLFLDASIDGLGTAYAGGHMIGAGQNDFGSNITVSGVDSNSNLVLVSYDTNGNTLQAKSVLNGTNPSKFYSVGVDNVGDPYAGGYINGNTPFDFGNNVTVNGAYNGNNAVIVKYRGNYTDSSSSHQSSSSSGSKQPAVSSSSSSNPAVVSEASSIKHGVPKLFAVGGAILLLF